MRRHFVIVGILVIVMTILTYIGLDSAGLMPVQASTQAVEIDWMWNLEVIAISFLFALIVVPLFYSLVVFRRLGGAFPCRSPRAGHRHHPRRTSLARRRAARHAVPRPRHQAARHAAELPRVRRVR